MAAKKKKKKLSKRTATILKYPLTPALLKKHDFVKTVPASGKPFTPDADWKQTYTLRTSSGFVEFGLNHRATVEIQRKKAEGNSFTVNVKQSIESTDAFKSETTAEIKCSLDKLASPVSWKMKQSVATPKDFQKHVPPLEYTGKVEKGRYTITCNGKTTGQKISRPLAVDWCLFEAVQRLSDKDPEISFDLLEGLALLKPGQVIRPRDAEKIQWGDKQIALYRFSQTGPGVLPWDYWLDENRRLVFATSGSRAYVLQD